MQREGYEAGPIESRILSRYPTVDTSWEASYRDSARNFKSSRQVWARCLGLNSWRYSSQKLCWHLHGRDGDVSLAKLRLWGAFLATTNQYAHASGTETAGG